MKISDAATATFGNIVSNEELSVSAILRLILLGIRPNDLCTSDGLTDFTVLSNEDFKEPVRASRLLVRSSSGIALR